MKPIYITIICFCIVFPLQAQNDGSDSVKLSRELILEREYNPEVRDAVKINELPQVREPEAPKAAIEFSNYTVPFNVKPEISLLSPGSYFTALQASKKRGYLNLGISSFVDVDGDVGYQILNTQNDRLSIRGSHRSSNGKVKYVTGNRERKMKINDNGGGLSYSHQFDNLKLILDGAYTNSLFNYYGFSYGDEGSENEQAEPERKDPDQVNNIVDLTAGVVSNRTEDGLNYLFKLNYSYFDQKHMIENKFSSGPSENFIQLDMGLNKGFDLDKQIGLNAGFRNSSYSGSIFDNDRYSHLGLNPYFVYDGGNWSARLGVKLDILFDQEENFNIAPDIELKFRPEDYILLYLNMKGGVTNNNNRNMYAENRYFTPSYRIKDSYSSFDSELGVKATLNNFWFNLFAGYKYAKQEHFYYSYYQSRDYIVEDPFLGENFIIPDYSDAGVFKLGGGLKYQYGDLFHIEAKGVYYNWSLEKKSRLGGYDDVEIQAWNKPDFIADAVIGFKVPDFPLKFDLIYHLETGRKSNYSYKSNSSYLSLESIERSEILDMKNVNQMDLQGTYTINDSFSIFARLNNLLFQEYDLWYGYPAQGFNVMAGVNVKF